MTFPSYRVSSLEDLFDRCSPPVRRLLQAARRRVLALAPGSTERLRAGWGLIGYDAPAYFAYLWPGPDHVRLGFERGVLLADPEGLLEGEGTQVRWVAIRAAADLRRPALAALVREAATMARRGPARRAPPGRRS